MDSPPNKKCSRCNQTKTPDEFDKRKTSKDGLTYWCKECRAKHIRNLTPEEKEKQAKAHRKAKMLHMYGITPEQKDELFEKQGRLCAICRGSKPHGPNWYVDHDHKTGKVRGVLCRWCNSTLGLSREDIFRLMRCSAYLRNHKGLIHNGSNS